MDSSVIPTDKSSRTVADAVAADFGGTGGSPMTVAVTTAGPAATPTVAAYADRVNALPGVVAPGVPVQLDATTWQLDVAADGEPDGDGRPGSWSRTPGRSTRAPASTRWSPARRRSSSTSSPRSAAGSRWRWACWSR